MALGACASLARLVAVGAVVLAPFINAATASAQTPQGATLTVVAGTVVAEQSGGAVSQPAPSGMTLGIGDRVATLSDSVALVTFFEGSELELGEDTTVIIREIRSSGSEVHVTIEDVFGLATSRIRAFANPNSTYSVQTPGGRVVALARGSTIVFNHNQSNGFVTIQWSDCGKNCDIIVNGNVVQSSEQGSVTVDPRGNVIEGTDSPKSDNGSGTGDENPGTSTPGCEVCEEEEKEDEDDADTVLGDLGQRPLWEDILASRLLDQLDGFTATGSILALGLTGWSLVGRRPRSRR